MFFPLSEVTLEPKSVIFVHDLTSSVQFDCIYFGSKVPDKTLWYKVCSNITTKIGNVTCTILIYQVFVPVDSVCLNIISIQLDDQ